MIFLSIILLIIGKILICWSIWGMPEAVNEARYRHHEARAHLRAEERSIAPRHPKPALSRPHRS